MVLGFSTPLADRLFAGGGAHQPRDCSVTPIIRGWCAGGALVQMGIARANQPLALMKGRPVMPPGNALALIPAASSALSPTILLSPGRL